MTAAPESTYDTLRRISHGDLLEVIRSIPDPIDRWQAETLDLGLDSEEDLHADCYPEELLDDIRTEARDDAIRDFTDALPEPLGDEMYATACGLKVTGWKVGLSEVLEDYVQARIAVATGALPRQPHKLIDVLTEAAG
jgi:hypothetical protein